MSTIQNMLIDSLNGFSLSQIPLFFFQIICAALGALILQFIVNKKWGDKLLQYSAVIAAGIAVMASIAKYSLPVAVLGSAVIILLINKKPKYQFETVGQLLVVMIGVGCGVGSVIQTVLGCVLLFMILVFTPLNKEDA